jgi:hypothetical protein
MIRGAPPAARRLSVRHTSRRCTCADSQGVFFEHWYRDAAKPSLDRSFFAGLPCDLRIFVPFNISYEIYSTFCLIVVVCPLKNRSPIELSHPHLALFLHSRKWPHLPLNIIIPAARVQHMLHTNLQSRRCCDPRTCQWICFCFETNACCTTPCFLL